LTRDYLLCRLRGYAHEVFACLFLDNQHRVIAFEELFRGTIDGASVYPREVVKKALAANSAAVIFAHNHPSGVAEPSEADKHITQRLRQALGLIDVRVLDHFIVGEGRPFSFAEHGLI
jgi:DNA repair protein RadC